MTATDTTLTLERVIEAWVAERRRHGGDRATYRRERAISIALLGALAWGAPVDHATAATATGLPPDEIARRFAAIRATGAEFDAAGRLVGMALTLIPTAHELYVDARRLYAWCALDTIFLPGLLRRTAEVASTCPVTGNAIRLTVTPSGIRRADPTTTVLSVTVPGLSCRRDDDPPERPRTGPASDGCSQMHFFATREAGEQWLADHPGVLLLTPDEAFRLADARWLKPLPFAEDDLPADESIAAGGCC